MARLRFPGRPGHRFGRLGIKYGSDDTQKEEDPTTRFIANIHRGLRVFREIFGESDEEEFAGFSDREVATVEKKLLQLTTSLQNLQDGSDPQKKPKKCAAAPQDTSQGRFSQRRRLKATAQNVIDKMVTTGQAQRLKEGTMSKLSAAKRRALDADSKGKEKMSPAKLKRIKIRLRDGGQEAEIIRGRGRPTIFEKIPGRKMKVKLGLFSRKQKDDSSSEDSEMDFVETPKAKKKHEISKARKILDKAKKGTSKKQTVTSIKQGVGNTRIKNVKSVDKRLKSNEGNAKSKKFKSPPESQRKSKTIKSPLSPRTLISPSKLVRKQFIIPVMSARSSRHIKPNKRFLDEDTAFSTIVPSISKPEEGIGDYMDAPAPTDEYGITQESHSFVDKKCSLLDAPLILEGKRERKPSLKIIRKLTDEVQVKKDKKYAEELENSLRFDKYGRLLHSVKRSGKVILQKAKLCLNQAALNRSKAALVKTLQAQMRREEKMQKKQPKKEVTSDSSNTSSPEGPQETSQKKGIKFLPLGGSGFKPMSPIKFNNLSREQPVFGLSSLPAVPKFALESTTASLPTFQSTHQGKASLPSLPHRVSIDEDDYADVDDDFMPDAPKSKKGTYCIICGDPKGQRTCIRNCCYNCKRFYGRRTKTLMVSQNPFVCKNGGECGVSYLEKYCTACRYRKCIKLLEPPHKLLVVQHHLANYPEQTIPRRKTKIIKKTSSKSPIPKEKKDGKKVPEKEPKKVTEKATGPAKGAGSECAYDPDKTDIQTEDNDLIAVDSPKKAARTKSLISPTQTSISPKSTRPLEVKVDVDELLGKPAICPDPVTGSHMSRTEFWAWSKATGGNRIKQVSPSEPSALSPGRATEGKIRKRGRPPGSSTTRKDPKPDSDVDLASPIDLQDEEVAELIAEKEAQEFAEKSLPFSTPLTIDTSMETESDLFPEEMTESAVRVGGPRIKHVCRRAAVALGKPACFPSRQELTLSALPRMEKERILQLEERRPGTPDSDDLSLDEIIRQARDDREDVITIKRTPNKAFRSLVPRGYGKGAVPYRSVPGKIYKRLIRCKNCVGCKASCCGKCVNCKGMIKFGGRGVAKKACVMRKCLNPKGRRSSVHEDSSPTKSDDGSIGMENSSPDSNSLAGFLKDDVPDPCAKPESVPAEVPAKRSYVHRHRSVETVVSERPAEVQAHRLEVRRQRMVTKVNIVDQKTKRKDRHKGLISGITPKTRKKWPSFSQDNHLVKPDLNETFDIDEAWLRGVALVTSTATCVRTVCFLCGSGGQHELYYCNVCCEPFHSFCLDDQERPKLENLENWVCRRCQSCHVCGKPKNLLECQKCQDNYHPECLGPNYPTKRSRHKKIWLCPKCVRCKSCGATTPGRSKDARWTYDFSLCFDCGKLTDQGNYCPVCHKCYADDDWESKMIQCATCESWVHAKCETITDEMYQILSVLPEDIDFNCNKCCRTERAAWRVAAEQEMQKGLRAVIGTIVSTKSSSMLEAYKDEAAGTEVSADLQTDNEPADSMCLIDSARLELVKRRLDVGSNSMTSVPSTVTITPSSSSANLVISQKSSSQDLTTVATENNETHEPVNKTVARDSSETPESCLPKDSLLPSCSVVLTDVGLVSGHLNEQQDSRDSHTSRSMDNCLAADVKSKASSDIDTRLELLDKSHEFSQNPDQLESSENGKETSSDILGKGLEPFVPGVLNPRTQPESPSEKSESSSTSRPDYKLTAPVSCAVSDLPPPQDFDPVSASNDVFRTIMQQKSEMPVVPQDTDVEERKNHPKDFRAIRKKVRDNLYSSIEEFSDDIVRIIQYNLSHELEQQKFRRKANATIRSLFLKQMTVSFPWFDANLSRLWEQNQNLPRGMLPNAVIPPYADHSYAQWMTREEEKLLSPQPSPFKKLSNLPRKPYNPFDDDTSSIAPSDFEVVGDDQRKCALCHRHGDDKPNDAGRLLYCGQDQWAHINCALWSAEVYEEVDGALQCVRKAVVRGRILKCDHCTRSGATVGCCATGCQANFHFLCARERHCVFQEDKRVFCKSHQSWVDGEKMMADKFAVMRRTSIEPEHARQLKKNWHKGIDAKQINITAGSMTVESLGRLCQLSDCTNILLPVDYCISRVYWSTNDARRRCVYTCKVIEVIPRDKMADVVMKDITVVHDTNHPEYDHELSVSYMSSSTTVKLSSPKLTDYNSESTISCSPDECRSPKRRKLGSTENLCLPSCGKGAESLSQSWPESSLRDTKDPLSKSWPNHSRQKSRDDPVNLELLSPTTLKLLEKSDLSKLASKPATPVPCGSDPDMNLTHIVQRLNSAAAENKQRPRSRNSHEGSIDGSRHSREGSVDRSFTLSEPKKKLLTLDNLPEESVQSCSLDSSTPALQGSVAPKSTAISMGPGQEPLTAKSLENSYMDSDSDVVCLDGQYDIDSDGYINEQTHLSEQSDLICSGSESDDCIMNVDGQMDEKPSRHRLRSSSHRSSDGSPSLNLDGQSDDKPSTSRLRLRSSSRNSNDTPPKAQTGSQIPTRASTVNQPAVEEGTFRCQKCKRFYRTKESCEKHAKVCNFEVSTSEEEEDDEDIGEDQDLESKHELKNYPLRSRKLSASGSTGSNSSVPEEPARKGKIVPSQSDKNPIRTSVPTSSVNISIKPSMNPYVSLTPCSLSTLLVKDSQAVDAKSSKAHGENTENVSMNPPEPCSSVPEASASENVINAQIEMEEPEEEPVVGTSTTDVSESHAMEATDSPSNGVFSSTVDLGSAEDPMDLDCDIIVVSKEEDEQARDHQEEHTEPSVNANNAEQNPSISKLVKPASAMSSLPATRPQHWTSVTQKDGSSRPNIIRMTEPRGAPKFSGTMKTYARVGVTSPEIPKQKSIYFKQSTNQVVVVTGREGHEGATKVKDGLRTTVSSAPSSQGIRFIRSQPSTQQAMPHSNTQTLVREIRRPGPSTGQKTPGRQVKVVTVSPMNIEKLKSDQGSNYKTTTTFANILPKSGANPNVAKYAHPKRAQSSVVSPNKPIFGTRTTSTHGPVAQAVVQPIVQQAQGLVSGQPVQRIDSHGNIVSLQPHRSGTVSALHSPPHTYNLASGAVVQNSQDLLQGQLLQSGALTLQTAQQQQVHQIIGSGTSVNYLSNVGIAPNQAITGVIGQTGLLQQVQQVQQIGGGVMAQVAGQNIIAQGHNTVLPPGGTQTILSQTGSPPHILSQITNPALLNQGLSAGTVIGGQSLITQPQVQQQYIVSNQGSNLLNSVALASVGMTSPIMAMASSNIQNTFLHQVGGQEQVLQNLSQGVRPGYVAQGVSILGSNSQGTSIPAVVTQAPYTAVYTQAYQSSTAHPVSRQQVVYVSSSSSSGARDNVAASIATKPPIVTTATALYHQRQAPGSSGKLHDVLTLEESQVKDSKQVTTVCSDQEKMPPSSEPNKTVAQVGAENQSKALSHKVPLCSENATVSNILASLREQMAKGQPRPRAEITVEKSSFVRKSNEVRLKPVVPVPKKVEDSGDSGKKKMDLQMLCEQIRKQSQSLVEEGKRVKISGEIDEQGVTRFKIVASAGPVRNACSSQRMIRRVTPPLPTKSVKIGGVGPSRRYEQGMLGEKDAPKTARIPNLAPFQSSDKMLTTHLSLVKKALAMKKGVPFNRKRPIDEVQAQNAKKFKSYQQRANEMLKSDSVPEQPSSRVADPAARMFRPKILSPVQGIRRAVHKPLDMMHQTEKRVKQSRKENLTSHIRKDMPEVMRPHPLVHPKHHHQLLPEVLVEEEIEESPLAVCDDRQPTSQGPVSKDAPHLMYEISSDDGFYACADSMDKAWKIVTDHVQDARANARMKQISYASLTGGAIFGLTHKNVTYLLEQLPGAKYCRNYRFKNVSYEEEESDSEPDENISGSARAEAFSDRQPHDMFSFLMSKHRQRPPYTPTAKVKEHENLHKSQRRATSLDLPLAMRFRHLREHAKEAVGVYRSRIHGRGLFCKRDIDTGEMVIEYAGEVIRSALTDKRETYYESRNIGCYMFRIDDDDVVDATMNGNAARFINHSCEPNCYSKVITVDNKKHIVIFAMRAIKKGEELTYDYKFPYEEVKIPCTCATKKCRKYLN